VLRLVRVWRKHFHRHGVPQARRSSTVCWASI
jgi:hypothetical protein